MEAAKYYLHRSALNPVLLVLQTSKCKQVTQLNTQAAPIDPGCVIGGTANHNRLALLLYFEEAMTRASALGLPGAQQSDGGIWGQESNNSKCSSHSKSQGLRWACQGQLDGTEAIPQYTLRCLGNSFLLWEKNRVGNNCSKRTWNIYFKIPEEVI